VQTDLQECLQFKIFCLLSKIYFLLRHAISRTDSTLVFVSDDGVMDSNTS
jgi:hypothetical protein